MTTALKNTSQKQYQLNKNKNQARILSKKSTNNSKRFNKIILRQRKAKKSFRKSHQKEKMKLILKNQKNQLKKWEWLEPLIRIKRPLIIQVFLFRNKVKWVLLWSQKTPSKKKNKIDQNPAMPNKQKIMSLYKSMTIIFKSSLA